MAIPTEHGWREHTFYLRGPAGLNTFAFFIGGGPSYRAGIVHQELLADYPEPTDNSSDDFGMQTGGEFEVEIRDEVDDLDWFLLDENGDLVLLEDGSGNIILEY